MSILYLGGCVYIIVKNAVWVPEAIRLIVGSAFSARAAAGGAAGAAVMTAIRTGTVSYTHLLDFASVDVSFISLTKILLPAWRLLKTGGQMVCLIKPQFEAGREKVGKKGVVRERSVHREVIAKVMDFADIVQLSLIHIYTLKAAASSPYFDMKNMASLGLFDLDGIDWHEPFGAISGRIARMEEASKGKDTTTGHWEIAGICSPQPMPTYPQGFPQDVLDRFSEAVGLSLIHI